jgi:DNA-binding LacI/PurR family transcriptional regulator
MQRLRVRIEDVARQAGVSPTAVSFAFNNPHRLNAQTVQRILEAARELGYSPNPHAKALLSKSIGVIGILTPQTLPSIFANPFFPAFHEGVGQVCEENELSLLTISPVSSSVSEAIAKAPVDGLIVVGFNESHEEINLLHRRKMPFVIVDGDAINVPSINVDDETGAMHAARFLLERNHERILCMTFESDYSNAHDDKIYGVGQRRLKGYQRAFAEYGIPWNNVWLVPTGASVQAGGETFRNVWNSRNEVFPSAVLAVADIIAIGVLQAASELNIQVPHELAVIGYDDIPQSTWTYPQLTTVRQPILEKGEVAAQLLLSIISGDVQKNESIVLPTELVVRGSAI